jgi:uncharacterized membrane protein YhhN
MLQNISLIIAIALTIPALVAWVIALRTPANAQKSNKMALYLATLAAAWLIALLTPPADQVFYKGAIVLGLLFAVIGIALRVSGLLPAYVAHAFLLWTYILYAFAFASQTSGWPTPYALLLVAAAALLYYWLYPVLRELWSSIAVYALLMLLATWQALELAVQRTGDSWMGWAALGGMLLVTVASMLEAQASFRPLRPPARPQWGNAALPVFLLAQLAIAWSVWG